MTMHTLTFTDRGDGRFDVELVALEIDDAILSAVAAAAVANRDATVAVAAALLVERRQQASLGTVLGKTGVVGIRHVSRAVRDGLEHTN